MNDRDPSVGLKIVCSFMGGVILTGLGAFFTYPRDLATKADLATQQTEFQQKITDLEQTIADNHTQEVTTERANGTELTKIQLNMERVNYKLGLPDQP